MQRLLEILLGLDRGFLSREGAFSFDFNPAWPGQSAVGGPGMYNVVLVLLGALLVIWVYRREGRSKRARIVLGILRACVLAMLIVLLNRPTLTLGQVRVEPSVVAVLVDDTISMQVPDAPTPGGTKPRPRIEAALDLLTGNDAALVRNLARTHTVRVYRFGKDAQPVANVDGPDVTKKTTPASTRPADNPIAAVVEQVNSIKAIEDGTQVVQSLHTVLDELQGQRLAGVVLLTDGRDTPSRERPEAIAAIKQFGVPVYAVAVGSEKMPQNIELQSVAYEPSAFLDDFTTFKITVRGTGYEPGHKVAIVIKNARTGRPVRDEHDTPARRIIQLPDDRPVDVEIQVRPRKDDLLPSTNPSGTGQGDLGSLDLSVEAEKQDGEINDADNTRAASIAILDTQITLLYVDGYPRWEYRYLKNQMIRDKTVKVSCLLTSADPTFLQEGTRPIRQFPVNIEQLLDYDVVIFGDVDEHQFTDAQLQLVADFVGKRGGGFAMVAGPRYAPYSFKGTPLEPVLPVDIAGAEPDDSHTAITQGFRPVLTKAGADSPIFRFFPTKEETAEYLANQIQPLFWYCHGVKPKRTAEVYAEHPTDQLSNGHRAPILVAGHYGAGRVIFSAIDDSWRWRFYTGESIFDTYWVQQLRFLARSKKLGERRSQFDFLQPTYELGQQVTMQLRVLSPTLSQQLLPQIPVQVTDAAGQPIRRVMLQRKENDPELFEASYPADRIGRYIAHLPALGDGKPIERGVDVSVPKLELSEPQVDRPLLTSLGQEVDYDQARTTLPELIRSAAKTIPLDTQKPLWDAPVALVAFVLLVTVEWIMRKVWGMV